MPHDQPDRSRIGRSVMGGASCGLTYDAALLDAVAREERLRRPLRLHRWRTDASGEGTSQSSEHNQAESARTAAAV